MHICIVICKSFIHKLNPYLQSLLDTACKNIFYWILRMSFFAHFQPTDSKLVGPLSTEAPVLTITATSEEMKPVETQIEKQAGNLELWTPPCSSVSCSSSSLLILFSESDHQVIFDAKFMGVANWVTANPCNFSPPKSVLNNLQKFSPACYTIPIFHKHNQFTMQSNQSYSRSGNYLNAI